VGWANCGEDSKGRPIGYAHPATCDHPGCNAKIDRGLSYACGGMHGEGGVKQDDYGCEGYFCPEHLLITDCPDQLCVSCAAEYEKDHPEVEAA
jgi:hypothetical protein